VHVHPSFGRAEELENIRVFLDRTAGDGAALLLSGEPGVGKSLLLEAAVDAARAAGMVVLTASGVEFEADVSFAALNQVLLPLHDQFDRLSCAHRDALAVALGLGDGPVYDRTVVSDAALTLLRRVSTDAPLLLVVDDLQWVDRSSAAVLGTIARKVIGSRVGFLAGFRSEADSYFEPSGLRVLEVRPLDPDASAGLVSTRFPMLAARVLQRVLDEAQGNPLALLELPSALSDPQRTARRPLPAVLPLSRRLQSLFASRVGELPAATRQLLLLTALDGSDDLRLLRSTASGKSILDDLALAERARLLSIDHAGRQVTFRHPLVRSTVVEMSTSSERQHAHTELARLLVDQPERRAWHLAEAAVEPDEVVADLLEEIAYRILRRGDAVGAVTALLRAAELSPDRSDRGRRLAQAAYVGADVTGELRNASPLLVDARRTGPEVGGSLQAAVAASFVLLNEEGDVDTAHRLLAGAIETYAADHSGCDAAVVEALHTLLLICFFGGRAELWESFDDAMDRLEGDIPVVLSCAARTLRDPVRTAPPALEQLADTVSGLRDEVDPTQIVRTGMAASYVDRLGGCRDALWRVVRDGRQGGAVASAINALLLLCFDDLTIGHWEEAQQLADEGVELCEKHGYRLLGWPGRLTQALLAAARGDDETVEALTVEMSGWAAPRRVRTVEAYACHVRALAALGRGDFEEAYEQASAVSPPGVLASDVPHALRVMMELVDSAVRTNRHDEALAHVRAMGAANVAALSAHLALLVAGSAAIAAGEDRVVELFEQALALPEGERWPFDRARIQLAYGERLRRARATTESRRHLTAALSTFERLGARPWVTRAGKELQATGLTKLRGTGFGPASLTPQEREVAVLAAAGLSNKQIAERLFLSHRTVGSHLRQVFPKLGVNSRAALRDALAARRSPATSRSEVDIGERSCLTGRQRG
jgi:DNA-binding CsgD family transcriptional regulator